jgi:hypothetical protein
LQASNINEASQLDDEQLGGGVANGDGDKQPVAKPESELDNECVEKQHNAENDIEQVSIVACYIHIHLK